MKSSLDSVASIGLAVGGVLGLAGTLVTQRNLQSILWGIDGAALVVATALLALKFFRKGNDLVAAGFLVFALASSVMLIGTADSLEESAPSFAAGTALWTCALLLTSVPKEFSGWIRLVGVIGSTLFAITAARMLSGAAILPPSAS